MDHAPIQRMRERAQQLRRMAALAHDRSMIELMLKLADEVEADAARLETTLEQRPPGSGAGAPQ
jgi:hypothetical protein